MTTALRHIAVKGLDALLTLAIRLTSDEEERCRQIRAISTEVAKDNAARRAQRVATADSSNSS